MRAPQFDVSQAYPIADSRQLVGLLSAQGMSTRAIAPTVGVSVGQTHADIHRAGVQKLNTSPAPEQIDVTTGEVLDAAAPRPDRRGVLLVVC